MRKVFAMVVGALMLGALCLTGLGCGAGKIDIVVGGSSSISPLMEKLAGEFESKNSKYRVRVMTFDSSNGIEGVKKSQYHIGMASKTVSDDELDVTVICKDGLAVIVKSSNTDISNVTKQQLYDLYMENKPASDSIKKAVSREEGSGTRDCFDGLVGLKGKVLPQTVTVVQETELVITAVTTDANTLGYISLGSFNAARNMKKLTYQERDDAAMVEATAENVKNGTYKLARDFTLVTKKGLVRTEENAEVFDGIQALMDFIRSEAGKNVIEKNGYVSL